MFDTRRTDNAVMTIGPQISILTKIEWCPTRPNMLAALLKDTGSIKLFDLKGYETHLNDQTEPSLINREVSPFDGNAEDLFMTI